VKVRDGHTGENNKEKDVVSERDEAVLTELVEDTVGGQLTGQHVTLDHTHTTCTGQHSTHTHPFNGHFSGTTQVSQYQKGKTNLDFTEARDSKWHWHQLGHMQVCPRSKQITTKAPHH